MKKYLKTIIGSTLVAVFVASSYSCQKDDKSSGDDYTEYDTAVGYYYGDKFDTGTACFVVDMYNADDDQVGVRIQCFTSLPSDFASLNIAGSYSIASTGAALTYPGGSLDKDSINILGSYIYNYNTKEFILITGGTFVIVLSGDKYYVSAKFKGTNYTTGAQVNNLCYSFSGAIAFTDESTVDSSDDSSDSTDSLSFADIADSNYAATGDPCYLTNQGPSSWSGQVTPSSGQDQFYNIYGWGGKKLNIWCNFADGKIVIDNYTKVVEDETHEGYFRAITIDLIKRSFFVIDDDYNVGYDKSNRIMDFSGTYNGSPVYVGIIAKDKATGAFTGAFTDMYANAKLSLTPTSQSSGNVGMRTGNFAFSAFVSQKEFRNYMEEGKR